MKDRFGDIDGAAPDFTGITLNTGITQNFDKAVAAKNTDKQDGSTFTVAGSTFHTPDTGVFGFLDRNTHWLTPHKMKGLDEGLDFFQVSGTAGRALTKAGYEDLYNNKHDCHGTGRGTLMCSSLKDNINTQADKMMVDGVFDVATFGIGKATNFVIKQRKLTRAAEEVAARTGATVVERGSAEAARATLEATEREIAEYESGVLAERGLTFKKGESWGGWFARMTGAAGKKATQKGLEAGSLKAVEHAPMGVQMGEDVVGELDRIGDPPPKPRPKPRPMPRPSIAHDIGKVIELAGVTDTLHNMLDDDTNAHQYTVTHADMQHTTRRPDTDTFPLVAFGMGALVGGAMGSYFDQPILGTLLGVGVAYRTTLA
jgi:hypothetical protein